MTTFVNRSTVRKAVSADLPAIRTIYNQGIEDRIATLEEHSKSEVEIADWFRAHDDRYGVLVAERSERSGIVGWAALNPYSHRCADRGVADLSVYVERDCRGVGIGTLLIQEVERFAATQRFTKSFFSRLRPTTWGVRFTPSSAIAASAFSKSKAGSTAGSST